jgi:hypothetical protein
MRSVRFAQCFFAIAAAGLALLSLAYHDFVPGGNLDACVRANCLGR